MQVTIHQKNQAVHFEAQNDKQQSIQIDGAPSVGGEGKGMRPMEALLGALGTCTAIDLVDILRKQRQEISDLKIDVKGERKEGKAPSPFTAIRMNFILEGKLDSHKVERAVELSVNKYCSVKESLDPNIEVTYTIEIQN